GLERLAVERNAGLGSCEIQNGGDQIEIVDELIASFVLRDARTAHQERNLDRALIGRGLADQAVVAEQEAVVGGINQHRIVELVGVPQRIDHGGDEIVDRLKRLKLGAVVELEILLGLEADARSLQRFA